MLKILIALGLGFLFIFTHFLIIHPQQGITIIPNTPGDDVPTQPDQPPMMIRDNQGNIWGASGKNLTDAFSALKENGELWLPSTTFTVTENLCLSKNGVKIHGGHCTIIFTNGARLISSAFPRSGSDTTRYSKGLDNIRLEDFTCTGDGQLELTLGSNTVVRNITVEDTSCRRPGAFRFVLPTSVHHVSGLSVVSCHADKVWYHGFMINSALPGLYEIRNVLFDACTSSYAGFDYPRRGIRSDNNGNWSVGFDLAENYADSHLTIRDVLVRNCTATDSWESGFHMENEPTKINVSFENCISNDNGQKRTHVGVEGKTFYCSGFLVSSSGVTLRHCEANGNTRYGFYCQGT
jgi:hypothetical protein